MRKYYPLLSILFIVFCLTIKPAAASHWAGGSIVWECISPSQYRVTAILYRDCSGITAPTTVSVGYTNVGTGCAAPNTRTGSLSLALIPAFDRELYTPCEITPSRCKGGTRFGLEKYKYTGVFNVPTLPTGTSPACFDWTWSFSQCCRNNADNMVGQPNFFIDSRFSSIQVPCDNGPVVELNALPAYCQSEPVNIDLNVFDVDPMDSTTFNFIAPKISATGNIPYQGAYTPANFTPNVGGIFLNPNNGNISFIAAQQFRPVLAQRVNSYRNGVLIGYVTFDLQLNISLGPICDNVVPRFRFPEKVLSCGDSTFRIELNTVVNCGSIDTLGGDFRLIDNNGSLQQILPIISAKPVACNAEDRTKFIDFRTIPLNFNKTYYLISKKGPDGNVVVNKCGLEMREFDTMRIVIRDCYEYKQPMELLNISVDSITNDALLVQWKAPDTLDVSRFKQYNLYHSADPANNGFNQIATITNVNTLEFRDGTPPYLPSADVHYYQINLSLLNNQENEMSNTFYSIKFKESGVPPSNDTDLVISFDWRSYQGWLSPSYYFQYQNPNDNNWITSDTATLDTFITFTKPGILGTYKARVYAVDAFSPRKAYSNWIEFKYDSIVPPIPPPLEVVIPNVITPNGDGINDVFVVTNLDQYPGSKLTINNRWGGLVFKSEDYQNDFGLNVSPGIYYYVLSLPDGQAFSGTLTVIQ